ncbi:BLUF domain-containing protein [Mucilaginibacter litoreus]|uniref:BLUF domain-containing protein n=1 Tax=Mucilaginibacter litoreus TaxID=1048221 RepID=A0ABW3ARZ2_9SPHI
MHYIVYISAATKFFADSELKDLLLQSRKSNKLKEITGLLLYSQGVFMQVIEGKQENVMQLFEIIEKDARHNCIIKMLEGETDERVFPDWAMAFKTVSVEEFSKIEAYMDPANIKIPKDEECSQLLLIRSFFESNNMQ